MAEIFVFDTNIYFYALDASTGIKHTVAKSAISRAGLDRSVILLQVLGELANALSKRDALLLPAGARLINQIAGLGIAAHGDDIRMALATFKENGMQFWDAVIWAAARRNGCTVLFTEDYQNGRIVGGVKFCNPFIISEIELSALLA